MAGVLVGVSQYSLLAVRRSVGFGLHRNRNNSTSIICCLTRRLPKLRSSRGFGDRSDQRQCLLAAAASGAISSDPLKASTTVTVNSIQPDTVNGGGDGDGFGNRGEGGGGGGGDNDKGEGGSDENNRKMSGLSMSQKLTLAYAALVGAGGVMGYLKSGSQKSLLAGGLSTSLLYYVYTELPTRPIIASSIGLGLSAALLGVMGSRFKKSGKIFPAGVVSLVSLIMTGGYLHGILRSLH
ncbi:protein FATTY ACID EXPORT 2, chloroplastic-like [Corylus avellana]|uniref:protein FATTY ACID EXPORT 2, chloroplastic-like n=1 Tax=Corylus avellana TaxID=13451 RepID=UPI001E1EDB16|nr:protein FATTY ACID EXPORT 2, chloroplastic-like [Corylus avellana]